MSKWNGKRFSIYTSDEENVLGLVEELGTQVNHNTDNIKTKTDLYGDHKGTWQGLNRPTMSDEGMRAIVEDIIDNKIPSIETSLDNKITTIQSSLDNKASREDVAKISSGTPLFANSISEMTDTTKNYVNTTDGYVYIYSGETWLKTGVLYQSMGVSDDSISYNHIKNKTMLSNINSNNLFFNPTFENNKDGWFFINNDGHRASLNYLDDSFSMGIYVTKAVTGSTIGQRVPLSKLINGEYKVSCKKKTLVGDSYNGRLIIQLSNNAGSNLFEIYKSNGITSSVMEHTFEFNKDTLLSSYPTAEYLTITFGHNATTSDCMFYEPFLGLTSRDTNYNNFKYEKLEYKINELSNIVETPDSILSNKIATFNGDSICQGVVNGGGYAKILSDTEGLIVENKGIGGGTIAKGTYFNDNPSTPRHWICDTVNTMRNDVDYAIFEGGRNDYGVNVPLGTLTVDYTGTVDNTTFYGALEHLFRQALIRFEGKKIGFIIIHKANAEPYTRNKQGLTMEDYYNAIIKTCEKYSIPVCDLYKNSGLITAITELKDTYTDRSDGLHPNDLGYKKYYVPKISSWLKTL